MKITDESQITFSEDVIQEKKTYWQEIEFNGKTIGALAQVDKGFLEPIEDRYQKLAPESHMERFDGWYESEDEGYIFGYFFTLEKFIEYYNSLQES